MAILGGGGLERVPCKMFSARFVEGLCFVVTENRTQPFQQSWLQPLRLQRSVQGLACGMCS